MQAETMTEKTFRTVAVLKGGPSAEREVSLASGAAVAQGLRQAGYNVLEIDLHGEQLHKAIADVRATHRIFERLLELGAPISG